VGVLLPVVIGWTILAFVRQVRYQRSLVDNVRVSAANTGEIIEGSLQHAMLTNDFGDLYEMVIDIGAQARVKQLFLLDKGGRVLVSTDAAQVDTTIDLENETCQTCHQYEAASRNESVILDADGGARVFRNVNAIENSAECTGCHDAGDAVLGVLITDLDMSSVDRVLAADRRRNLLWSLGSVLLVTGTVHLLMSRLVIDPLERLVHGMRRVSAGDLDVQVPSQSSDETGELTRSFNEMVGGLRERDALEGRLKERTEALQAQTERLSVLNALAEAVSQSLDIDKILDSTLRTLHELLHVRASWVVLRNDEHDAFELVAGHGLPEGIDRSQVLCAWDQSTCSDVYAAGESKILQDVQAQGCPMVERFRREGFHARVCVPLHSKDRVLGVMSLVGSAQDGAFSLGQDTLDLLNAVGQQVGMAIENAQLYAELRREEMLRRHLLERTMTAQEEERKRIALELHDQTGQILTSLIMTLGVLGEADSLSAVREHVADVREMAAQVLKEVHDLALELRPSVLDDLGLLAALRDLHKAFRDRFRFPIDFQVLGLDARRLPAHIETALYRIVQEALTNVARHARAHGVSVLLECRRSAVKLIVEDDGVGFDVLAAQHAGSRERLGLYGMRERASLVGGQLTIESSPGMGTAVYVEIPLDRGEDCRGQDPIAGC
jgi:signal transduction histidine kinase